MQASSGTGESVFSADSEQPGEHDGNGAVPSDPVKDSWQTEREFFENGNGSGHEKQEVSGGLRPEDLVGPVQEGLEGSNGTSAVGGTQGVVAAPTQRDATITLTIGRAEVTLELVPDITKRVIVQLRERAKQIEPDYPTGILDLDTVTWGLWKKQLLVVAARPGSGKTSFALQVADNLASRGKAVVFVSYEMTREELASRLFARRKNVNLRDLNHYSEDEDGLDRAAKAFAEDMKDKTLQIVDDLPRDWKHLREFLEMLDPAPDAVFIDHLQEVSTIGFRSPWDAYTEYVAAIKHLSKKLNTAVVLCSQLHRPDNGDSNPRPQLHDLKGTGAIEEKADTVILMWPTERLEDGQWGDGMKLLVDKQRNGPIAEIGVDFKRKVYRFA